jgi:hypothetical protein
MSWSLGKEDRLLLACQLSGDVRYQTLNPVKGWNLTDVTSLQSEHVSGMTCFPLSAPTQFPTSCSRNSGCNACCIREVLDLSLHLRSAYSDLRLARLLFTSSLIAYCTPNLIGDASELHLVGTWFDSKFTPCHSLCLLLPPGIIPR